MNINFRAINKRDIKDFEVLEKWHNDEEIKPFLVPNRDGKPLKHWSAEDLMFGSISNPKKYAYFILDGEKLIGDFSIDTNFSQLKGDSESAAWISICIGEKEYWGTGASAKAMEFIDEICKELKMKRIELGVFMFNLRAVSFYKRIGYEPFETVESYAFYNGEWYDDVRMEKLL